MENLISQKAVIEKALHPEAKKLAKQYIKEFSESLLMQSKAIATIKKADVVISSHVEEALKILKSKQEDSWLSEFNKIIGGALFGTFIQGFTTELEKGNTTLIVTYTIMGFVGMFLIFWSFRK